VGELLERVRWPTEQGRYDFGDPRGVAAGGQAERLGIHLRDLLDLALPAAPGDRRVGRSKQKRSNKKKKNGKSGFSVSLPSITQILEVVLPALFAALMAAILATLLSILVNPLLLFWPRK
jgi:hypothetical protein